MKSSIDVASTEPWGHLKLKDVCWCSMQASILSLVPYHLLWNVIDTPKLKAVNLRSLVNWVSHLFTLFFVHLICDVSWKSI
jgi:hypothetical protein